MRVMITSDFLCRIDPFGDTLRSLTDFHPKTFSFVSTNKKKWRSFQFKARTDGKKDAEREKSTSNAFKWKVFVFFSSKDENRLLLFLADIKDFGVNSIRHWFYQQMRCYMCVGGIKSVFMSERLCVKIGDLLKTFAKCDFMVATGKNSRCFIETWMSDILIRLVVRDFEVFHHEWFFFVCLSHSSHLYPIRNSCGKKRAPIIKGITGHISNYIAITTFTLFDWGFFLPLLCVCVCKCVWKRHLKPLAKSFKWNNRMLFVLKLIWFHFKQRLYTDSSMTT